MTVGVADNRINVDGDDSVYLPYGDVILAPRVDSNIDDYNYNDRKGRGRQRQRMLKGGRRNQVNPRNLQQSLLEGKRQVLVIRVTDSEGRVHPHTAATISDNLFGTQDDKVNFSSQFRACSFNTLQMTNQYTNIDISNHESAPGVVDVQIPISLQGHDRKDVRNAVLLEAQSKLGLDRLPGPFQNVIVVLEGCYTDCGWAGYAFVNSWLSVFQADHYSYVGVQVSTSYKGDGL